MHLAQAREATRQGRANRYSGRKRPNTDDFPLGIEFGPNLGFEETATDTAIDHRRNNVRPGAKPSPIFFRTDPNNRLTTRGQKVTKIFHFTV